MGKSVVKEGAVLSCSLGTEDSILRVPRSHGVSAQAGNQANISDCIGGINIISFHKCRCEYPPVPCNPEIVIKWLKGQKNCILDGEPALLEDCIVPCIYGGIIKIITNGQKS